MWTDASLQNTITPPEVWDPSIPTFYFYLNILSDSMAQLFGSEYSDYGEQTLAFFSRSLTKEELRNSLSLLFSSCSRASSSSLCSRVSCSWERFKKTLMPQSYTNILTCCCCVAVCTCLFLWRWGESCSIHIRPAGGDVLKTPSDSDRKTNT